MYKPRSLLIIMYRIAEARAECDGVGPAETVVSG